MPELKPISGHTGCYFIRRYLEKNDRAIARDYFNLDAWDERAMEGYDESPKAGIDWAREMDAFRELHGNHLPVGGMRARTFKHFVLSPDPEDDISLEQLRDLTKAWVLRFWPDYQSAIVYHDDNAGRIPHAHIVVNNTNVVTFRRMHTDNPLELNQVLQDMARERGLRGMSNVVEAKALASKDDQAEIPDRMTARTPRTRQRVYLGRQEKEIVASGGYSWVSDIRNRVSIARSVARSEDEFREMLSTMGVDVADNSAGARRRDWVFSLSEEPSKKVSGERLGYMFGKEALGRRFERIGSYRPSERSAAAIAVRAERAVILNDVGELEAMSRALETCSRYGIRSIEEAECRIERAASPEQKDELEAARDYMGANSLLPRRVSRKAEPQRHLDTEQSRRKQLEQAQQQQRTQERSRNRERSR